MCLLSNLVMKPIMASDVLRDSNARNARARNLNGNRFNHLRADSPAEMARSRSSSTKRKSSDSGVSYAAAAKKTLTSGESTQDASSPLNCDRLEALETNIAKMSSICEKITADSRSLQDESPLSAFMAVVSEALCVQNQQNLEIVSALREFLQVNPAEPKQAHKNLVPMDLDDDFECLGTLANNKFASNSRMPRPTPITRAQAATATTDDTPPEIRKFKEAVKDAEKSTVIFNLDLGRVPIINQATICKNATVALTAKAAVAEGRRPNDPSNETVDAIDDILSVAKNVSFFGASTKSYVNTRDAASGSYCTIPVKYDFKDKDTRIRVEQILRSRCKVSCATPYPPILRECIKKVIASGKHVRPDDFVRVGVDAAKMSFRLSWRTQNTGVWVNHENLIPIPKEALDTVSRRVPDNIVIENLPVKPVDTAQNPATVASNDPPSASVGTPSRNLVHSPKLRPANPSFNPIDPFGSPIIKKK